MTFTTRCHDRARSPQWTSRMLAAAKPGFRRPDKSRTVRGATVAALLLGVGAVAPAAAAGARSITAAPAGAPCEPVAVDDAYESPAGATLDVGPPGVLANDTHCDGFVSQFTDPPNGTIAMNADGSFQYSPDAGFTGVDAFGYGLAVGDATLSNATVTITVTGTSCEMVAVDDTYETVQGVVLDVPAPGVLGNDTLCPEFTGVNAGDGSTQFGGTWFLDNDGSFRYEPPSGFVGRDSFMYNLNAGDDLSPVDSAFVFIDVVASCEPVVVDDAYEVVQDGVLDVGPPGVKANDTHCNWDVAVLSLPARGTLELNADGSFLYTPNEGFTGVDEFEYKLEDPGASAFGFASGASLGFGGGQRVRNSPQGAPGDEDVAVVSITVTESPPADDPTTTTATVPPTLPADDPTTTTATVPPTLPATR